MAMYVIPVIVEFDVRGLGVVRETQLIISSDAPPTGFSIQARVEELVREMVTRQGYEGLEEAFELGTYTWTLEGVFRAA